MNDLPEVFSMLQLVLINNVIYCIIIIIINKFIKTINYKQKVDTNTTVFNRFAHPWLIVDVLTDVYVEEIMNILLKGFFIEVMDDVVIDTSFGV